MKNSKGFTLVALIITIIILLILAVVTIREVTGTGLISNAIKARFYQEMSNIEEQRKISKFSTYIDKSLNKESGITYTPVSLEELKEFDETLKAEIIFVRRQFGDGTEYTTEKIWKSGLFDCRNIWDNDSGIEQEQLTDQIFYIPKEVTGKEKAYIYDSKVDVCYKISNTSIGLKTVHSLPYAKFILDGENSLGYGLIEDESGITEDEDGTKYYEPNLKNFSYKTEIIYYSENNEEYKISVKEYLENGKQKQIENEGNTYYFCNYSKKIWANIKCTANDIESYWVWIPRYVYKLDNDTQTSSIIFVDLNDKQMDGSDVPEGYVLHEAFTQGDGLKGIWFSKYNPSSKEVSIEENVREPGKPDLSNFNAEKTKLIYYNEDCTKSIEVDYSANPAQTLEQNGETYYFYNYTKKIWANIKCNANNIESYWVWIPRYAYKLNDTTQSSAGVIFVDENNKPIDTIKYGAELPEGYVLHEAFKQDDGLKGIWISKYNPSKKEIEE